MYDSNTQAVSDKLKAASSTVFTQDVINDILSLVTSTTDSIIKVDTVEPVNGTITPAAGTEVVFVTTSDTQVTNVTVNANVPAIFFQGAGGVNATIGSATPSATGNSSAATVDADAIARVVVGTAGADTITVTDGKNTQIIAGDKDVIKAGSGHTVVVAAQGNSTVVGGAETIVEAKGGENDFTITVANGHAKIANATTKVSVDLTGVQYVQLDNSQALIFAENVKQAAVANLYQAVFARTAEFAGLDFWFEQADKGVSLKAIAQGFMASSEYKLGELNNTEFVDALYKGVMGRTGEAAGTKFWTDALTAGVSRADVIVAFAEAAATSTSEATIIGSVTVVPDIV